MAKVFLDIFPCYVCAARVSLPAPNRHLVTLVILVFHLRTCIAKVLHSHQARYQEGQPGCSGAPTDYAGEKSSIITGTSRGVPVAASCCSFIRATEAMAKARPEVLEAGRTREEGWHWEKHGTGARAGHKAASSWARGFHRDGAGEAVRGWGESRRLRAGFSKATNNVGAPNYLKPQCSGRRILKI